MGLRKQLVLSTPLIFIPAFSEATLVISNGLTSLATPSQLLKNTKQPTVLSVTDILRTYSLKLCFI